MRFVFRAGNRALTYRKYRHLSIETQNEFPLNEIVLPMETPSGKSCFISKLIIVYKKRGCPDGTE